MSALPERPLGVLVAALGGEGGGVLSSWLVAAATRSHLPVQSTSIPGVAQRTGATTYYIEILPAHIDQLAGREPVLALTPSPANVDVVVTSELLEAGRVISGGFVTPDRTALIASTHRVYAIAERGAMADGRYDGERVLRAAREMARSTILFDMAQVAAEAGSAINAVLLGAIAGSGLLPIRRESFEAAIRGAGIAVPSNLAGFTAGYAIAAGGTEARPPAAEQARPGSPPTLGGALDERIGGSYPAELQAIVREAAARLVDYQDEAYARLYLEHLDSIHALDRSAGGEHEGFRLSAECGRYLALWMAYEDVIRVADLKTRASRLERVRAEVGAEAGEPIRLTEFLKPGLEELTSLLPRWLALVVVGLARRLRLEHRLSIGLYVRTTSVSGFLSLWLMSKLRRWRRRSSRYAREQALIARWLDAVSRAARLDYALALEVVECARLIKGYGETHLRGLSNFLRIMEDLVAPALEGGAPAGAAARVARAREAALQDPDGAALEKALTEFAAAATSDAAAAAPAAAAGE